MEIAMVIAIGVLCIVCFLTGASVGQKVSRGEEVKPPAINPIEAYREREAKKEAKAEQDRLDAIMQNIESYDGTGYGQKDVPGR